MANDKVHLFQIVAARRQPVLVELRFVVHLVEAPQILGQLRLALQRLLNELVVLGSRHRRNRSMLDQLSLVLVVAATQRRIEALHDGHIGRWRFVIVLGLGHVAHEPQQRDPDGLRRDLIVRSVQLQQCRLQLAPAVLMALVCLEVGGRIFGKAVVAQILFVGGLGVRIRNGYGCVWVNLVFLD